MKSQIGKVAEHYPEEVQKLVIPTMQVIDSANLMDGIRDTILEKLFSDIALNKFLSGGEMLWSEEEFESTLRTAFAQTQIENLRDLGLIDSIEDENGEEVVWLTDRGKELAKALRDQPETIGDM